MGKKPWRVGPKEYAYVREVLEWGFGNSSGPGMVTRLEALFAEKFNVKYAISHCNGTATLHTALAAVGVGPGDEVIVPPLTMASTAYAVLHQNAVPVFADVDEDTFLIDPADIERRLTPRTKAIIPVSLYGLAPEMDAIMSLARKHNLAVIEDDAQCFLGYYKGKVVGSLGDMASFSFQSSKHMTSGEGGMLVTSNPDLAARARSFSVLGYAGLSAEPGKSHVPKHLRQEPDYKRHAGYGWNYRLPELCAAVALGQLERLEELVALRQQIATYYAQAITGSALLVLQQTPAYCVHSYWAFAVRFEGEEQGITWRQFRDKYVERGGDGFYGAWSLTYREPAFQQMAFQPQNCPVGCPHYSGQVKRYEPGLCPVAERLQPKIMAFKTNYGSLEEAKRQADILFQTLQFFSRG